MNALIALCVLLSNYGFSYDGLHDSKHYFQINTPEADYGWVLSEKELYCDVVYYKN